jgi:hypothetical protein
MVEVAAAVGVRITVPCEFNWGLRIGDSRVILEWLRRSELGGPMARVLIDSGRTRAEWICASRVMLECSRASKWFGA